AVCAVSNEARGTVDASCSAVEQMGDRVGISAARERMRRFAPRRVAAGQRSQRDGKSPSVGGKSTNTGTSIGRRKSGRTGPRPRTIARSEFEFEGTTHLGKQSAAIA